MPALIVWGRNDMLVPVDDADEFEQLIGENARSVVFEDTGHVAMIERPEPLQRAAWRELPRRRAGARRRGVERALSA